MDKGTIVERGTHAELIAKGFFSIEDLKEKKVK